MSGNTIDLEDDAANDITIVVAGTGTSDSVTLILDDADVGANVQAATVETLNIISTGTADGGANVITGTTAVNSLAGSQSIVITGAEALTFTDAVTADVIDGSAMTDVLTITAGTAASAQVSGGSAADVLNLADGNADIVSGGAGNDVLTFDIEVSDQLTGGTGNDIFQMDNDTDTSAAGAIITDFSTSDELDLDLSTLEALTVDGATANNLTDMTNNDVGAGDLTFAFVGADNTTLNAGQIVVLTGKTYADAAAALADIQGTGDRTFINGGGSYADNDGVLIAYELASGGVELAVVQEDGAAGASSDSLDAIDVAVTLVGVTAATLSGFNIDMDA